MANYLPNSNHKAAHRICDLCFRECGGLCVQYRSKPEFPAYHSCSKECDDVLLDLVISGYGFIQTSDMQRIRSFALVEMRKISRLEGLLKAFDGVEDGVIDGIFIAVLSGVFKSMHAQSLASVFPA